MNKEVSKQRMHIVGGGMVGLCLALALKDVLDIKILEMRAWEKDNEKDKDIRALALSYSSIQILKSLQVWSSLESFSTPLKEIHVSEQSRFGVTRLSAKEAGYEQLGAIVPAHVLGQALMQAVMDAGINLIAPANIEKVDVTQDKAEIYVNNTLEETDLLVIANGANSALASQLGIGYEIDDRHASALVSVVEVSCENKNVAYERFVEGGIIALLPLSENRYGVVWTTDAQKNLRLMHLDDHTFLEALQKSFGYRVGRFKKMHAKRVAYPLNTILAQKEVMGRAVVLGNAAHTIHPAAGQGLNLALRRMAVFAEEIAKAALAGESISHPEVLGRYLERTYSDKNNVISFTKGLVTFFSHEEKLLASIRSLGLFCLDRAKPIKQMFVKNAMGIVPDSALMTQGVAIKEALTE